MENKEFYFLLILIILLYKQIKKYKVKFLLFEKILFHFVYFLFQKNQLNFYQLLLKILKKNLLH